MSEIRAAADGEGKFVDVTTVRKHVWLHAKDDDELARRIDTFNAALRACDGVVVKIKHRGRFRGRRLAVVYYEFPLRPCQPGSTSDGAAMAPTHAAATLETRL